MVEAAFAVAAVVLVFLYLIFMLIGSAIAAVFLKTAARWVEKVDVSFSSSFVTMFLAGVVNAVLGFAVGLMARMGTQVPEAAQMASWLMLPTGFVVQSAFVSNRIAIPFGRACLISLVMIGMVLAIVLALAAFAVAIFLMLNFAR
ncbi:MAG: hypothetical protein ACLP9L_16835 [Thermoguttaceae bacterium]